MVITKNAEGKKLTVALEGRLDTGTSSQLEAELRSSIDGVEELVLDLENLAYMSSAGLRVLLAARKVMNRQGSMKVIHVNETIAEIFEITGFNEILTVE